MKKILVILAAIVLTAGMPFGQTQSTTFNLSLYLNEYIETMPGPVAVNLGTTGHRSDFDAEMYGMIELTPWDFAYANCPFRATFTGDNPAGEGKPRFARQETGAHASGFDTLSTRIWFSFWIDGVRNVGVSDAYAFPYSWTFAEAPHNGQVLMGLLIYANWSDQEDGHVPQRHTVINPAFTNRDSADAGLYTCTMVVTLGAL
jgi:hypothetical protein